jgi:SWI/SNF-related matrix-associated actin-dependent regulator of chromatin subfamily A3
MINEWFQELKKYAASGKLRGHADNGRHFDQTTLKALTTIKYHGQNRERDTVVLCNADIIITTYHTLAAECASSRNLINDIEWYRLVLDEGTGFASFVTTRI